MNIKPIWRWILLPVAFVDSNNVRKFSYVSMLIKETPYNKLMIAFYTTGLIVDQIKIVEFH